ncbi:hypothetical protein [Streptomyces indicus]|uniref:Integral membrane protein n=1 Tax=Streptomyces indicus TaxID=417292 RepID=A0A1G9EFZ4_9ACTN|nr:hypothetical protein [Streptomyces indicus]SDK74981.1 hypothetical protein SAMN05421806_111142 [Streptomyces indicus]
MPDRMPSPSSSSPQGSSPQGSSQDANKDPEGSDNPFAPPPEGAPEQPWRPRHPEGGDGDGRGDGGGQGGGPGWSPRQPGRSSGGFGQRPGPEGGQNGPGGPMRWDPTDPAQRRARYALLGGMWAFFFGLFGWPYVALLLGALAVYWGVTSLRAKPKTPDPTQPAPAPGAGKPQTTAAVSGLVTGGLALAMVALTFSAQLVYRDYYVCERDANTHAAQKQCEELLPKPLRTLLGEQD